MEEKRSIKSNTNKKMLKENQLEYSDFKINDKTLIFKTNNIEKFELLFYSKKTTCKSI